MKKAAASLESAHAVIAERIRRLEDDTKGPVCSDCDYQFRICVNCPKGGVTRIFKRDACSRDNHMCDECGIKLEQIADSPATAKGPLEDEIRAKCAEIAEMLVAKNRAYGNSALEPTRIFARDLDATAQIRVRVDDKLSRLARGLGSSDESLRDTTRDLIGYLVLLEIARDKSKEGA